MDHIDREHIETIHSWPAPCGCGMKAKDAMGLRYHLSDAHGLWKAEWKKFGVKDPVPEDEDIDEVVSISDLEDGDETRPRQRRKLEEIGVKFIECSSFGKPETEDPPLPRRILPDRAKPPSRVKPSQKRGMSGWTFVEWSSPSSDSLGPSSDQYEGLCSDEPPMSTAPSLSCYPEPGWDSHSVILIDNDEEKDCEFDGQARLVRSSQGGDRSDDTDTADSVDEAFWLDDGKETEGSTTDPTSVSTPLTDTCSDMFKDLLDPALFSSEGPASQPPSFGAPQGIKTPQSVGEVDFDLPSLESLLNHGSTGLPSGSHINSGHKERTESASQLSGWVEVPGPKGNPILQELSDDEHEPEIPPHTDETGEEEWFEIRSAHDGPVVVSRDDLVSTESDRVTVNCPMCGADVAKPPKKQKKRLDMWEMAELCKSHRVKDAETEWARRGYPRIGWRRLKSRLDKFSPVLHGILKGELPSFYRSALESAVGRRESHGERCMDNATAGYYGPRGQVIM